MAKLLQSFIPPASRTASISDFSLLLLHALVCTVSAVMLNWIGDALRTTLFILEFRESEKAHYHFGFSGSLGRLLSFVSLIVTLTVSVNNVVFTDDASSKDSRITS